MATEVMLDRTRREALRREMQLITSGWGDLGYALKNGELDYLHKSLKRLRQVAALMDAIGWIEQADAPDEQPVEYGRTLAAFARAQAEEMMSSFGHEVPDDAELDAYAALCAVGGDA
jgi:hypothetical protein